MLARVFLLAAVLTPLALAAEPLKICAFNVQIFGINKAKNDAVMKYLAKIVSRYDLCLIQEVRDPTTTAVDGLLNLLNKNGKEWTYVISDRLGRTTSKEQYAYFYRTNRVTIKDSYHFDDGDEEAGTDLFQREPFIVRVAAKNAAVSDFFIIGIHTEPESAIAEIDHLVEVYDDAAKRFKIKEGIVMGDFNAGCGYYAKKNWPNSAFRNDERFTWLIDDYTKTTVGKAVCAYDRAVVAGPKMTKAAKNAQVYKYSEDFDTDEAMMKLISDHFPIEFTIG